MARTRLVAITDIAVLALQAVSHCDRVTVREDHGVANWPTVALLVRMPDAAADAVTVAPGLAHEFTRTFGFRPGDVIAHVRTVAGVSTLAVIEEGR